MTLITGGAGPDTLTGTAETDLVFGRGGAHFISGREGDDAIFGGPGDDTCRGRSNFRPPPRHTPQAPTTYHPKANLVVRVWAA